MLSRSPENAEEETPPDESSRPNMHRKYPFPLTPVQHAYLTGRMPGQTLGGVGCHLYQEFRRPLSDGVAAGAGHHDLAATPPNAAYRLSPRWQQVWLLQPYWNGVTVHDLRHNDAESRQPIWTHCASA